MRATVYHNSRHVECTLSENQAGLEPYEVRVYVGERGARILRIDEHEIVVHEYHVKYDVNIPPSSY